MPIYEFVCAECDHEFESLQRLSDPLPTVCPACGKGPVSKKISAAGFRLKGGGWYETDFKNGSKSSGAQAKPAADSAGGSTGGSTGGNTGDSTGGGADAGADSKAGSSSDSGGSKDAGASSTASPSKPSKPAGGSSE